ncbi:unnamed protein product [Moneuplotes crassus]|uniref:Dystroglycan-type cadherin-like domain-containing protein n=1 Tax=Euplotes crassus TaxID=5936 RepID=A0AAD1UAU9_EUPCR|nr:unnamed protein product [Moneuplotes crassus]
MNHEFYCFCVLCLLPLVLSGNCDDAFQYTHDSSLTFQGHSCCISGYELFFYEKSEIISGNTVKASVFVLKSKTTNPYDASGQFANKILPITISGYSGFRGLQAYADTGANKFIVVGQHIYESKFFPAFCAITPGNPPSFEVKYIPLETNSDDGLTTRRETNVRLLKPFTSIGHFCIFHFAGHLYPSTYENMFINKVNTSTLQTDAASYLVGSYNDGTNIEGTKFIPMVLAGSIILSDNTIVSLSYISPGSNSIYFPAGFYIWIGNFTHKTQELTAIQSQNFNFAGLDGVNTPSGERALIYGSIWYSSESVHQLFYTLISPVDNIGNSSVVYSMSRLTTSDGEVFFYQNDNAEGFLVTKSQNNVILRFNISDGAEINVYYSSVLHGDSFISSYNSTLYYHRVAMDPYIVSKFSESDGNSCLGQWVVHPSTGTAQLNEDRFFYESPRSIDIGPVSTMYATLSVGYAISDYQEVGLYQEYSCGSYSEVSPNPLATEIDSFNKSCAESIETSRAFDIAIESKYSATCTLNSTQMFARSVFYTNIVWDSSDNPVTWASISPEGAFAVSNIPCSIQGVNIVKFLTNIGEIGEYNITVQINVTGPPPQINQTVVDQQTTALNTDITYDVSQMFKNLDGHPSVLVYSATLSDGSPLPSWAIFDASTKVFIFDASATNTATIKLICTNDLNYNATQEFIASIINNLPQVVSPMGTVTHEDNITFTETFNLTEVFNEVDPNQVLTYQIVSSPAPPSFVSATISTNNILTVSGCASVSDVGGTHRVQVNALDGFDLISDILTIVITENKSPNIPSGIQTSLIGYEDTPSFTTFPAFTDDEGNPISYNVINADGSALNNSWINFDPTTRNLSYTPFGDLFGPIMLKLIARDDYNDPVVVDITLQLNYRPRDNPIILDRNGEFMVKEFSYYEIPNTIISHYEPISTYWVTLNDGFTPPPSWLTISDPHSSASGNFEFFGTYPTSTHEVIILRLYARDSLNREGFATITIESKFYCHNSCQTCNGPDIDDCLACQPEYFKYQTMCKTVCPDGYYGDTSDNSCQPCNSACGKCTGPTDLDCTECKSNSTHLYSEYNGQCVDPCPAKLYKNVNSLKCEECHPFCLSCYGPLSTQCTACNTNNRYVLTDPNTCMYLTCPEQYYYDKTSQDCQPCHKNCKECSGPNSEECLSCPFSRFLNQPTGTCLLCTEINSGLYFESLSNTCIEQCGKGYNLGFIECDDGNNADGDGCSSQCTVETNWSCDGGNQYRPDLCASVIVPIAELASINQYSSLASVLLNEKVTFGEYNEGDISIDIEGPLAPYEFKFYINPATDYVPGEINIKFKIQFEFLSSLLGDHHETIIVTFNNPEMFIDLDGNSLSNKQTTITIPFFKQVLSEEEKKATNTQSGASILSLLLAFGSSTAISVIFGSKIEATWLLFGCIQLMSFVPLFNVNLPGNFREFSKNLAILHGEPGGIPNLFESTVNTTGLQPFNKYFETMGFKTELLVMNSGRKIELWIIMFFSMGISFILFDLWSESRIGKIVRMIDTKIRYGFLIRSVSQFYLSLFLCSVLNLYIISWSGTNVNYFNNFCALVGMFAVIYVPIKSFNIIYKAGDLNSKTFKKRYKTIISGLKTSGPMCFQFVSIFYFRRGVYASILVLLYSTPLLQIMSASILTVAMACYLIIVKPYESSLSTFLSISNEFLLILMIFGSFRFVNPVMTPTESRIIGKVFIGVLISTIFLNWASIIFQGIKTFLQNKRRKKKIDHIMKLKEANDWYSVKSITKLKSNSS